MHGDADDPHLFHPEQVRTGERIAPLEPPRAYWAGCALCGASVDLAAPARAHARGRPPQRRAEPHPGAAGRAQASPDG